MQELSFVFPSSRSPLCWCLLLFCYWRNQLLRGNLFYHLNVCWVLFVVLFICSSFCCFATEERKFSEVSCIIISMVYSWGLFVSCQNLLHVYFYTIYLTYLLFRLQRFSLGDENLVLKAFPGISPHLLVLEQMFWIPFFRDLWSTTGSVAATKVWQFFFIKFLTLPNTN